MEPCKQARAHDARPQPHAERGMPQPAGMPAQGLSCRRCMPAHLTTADSASYIVEEPWSEDMAQYFARIREHVASHEYQVRCGAGAPCAPRWRQGVWAGACMHACMRRAVLRCAALQECTTGLWRHVSLCVALSCVRCVCVCVRRPAAEARVCAARARRAWHPHQRRRAKAHCQPHRDASGAGRVKVGPLGPSERAASEAGGMLRHERTTLSKYASPLAGWVLAGS